MIWPDNQVICCKHWTYMDFPHHYRLNRMPRNGKHLYSFDIIIVPIELPKYVFKCHVHLLNEWKIGQTMLSGWIKQQKLLSILQWPFKMFFESYIYQINVYSFWGWIEKLKDNSEQICLLLNLAWCCATLRGALRQDTCCSI